MTTDDGGGSGLGAGAAGIVDRARQAAADYGDASLGVNHWLLAVVSRHGRMAEALTTGLSAATLRPWLHARLRADDPGAPLDEATLRARASALAATHGRATASEADVVEAVLRAAGYATGLPPTTDATAAGAGARPDGTGVGAGATVDAAKPPATGTPAPPAGGRSAGEARTPPALGGTAPNEQVESPASGPPGAGAWQPRATRPTPALDQFGRDLTAEAAAGRLPELVGRATELDIVIETLCRRTKRNPVLVGPAGTGKTAIVEGLAARVVAGGVPALLRGLRIVQLSPSALVSGAGVYGVLDERMRAILAEASQDGIALFIDELHSIVGAGGARGSSDIASLLKPALARGEIACIAATTDEEYRQYIEEDAALERRFAPVLVREPTVDESVAILRSHRDALARLRGVAVDDATLRALVRFSVDAMPERRLPDKAVELLEQVVAHAVATGTTTVSETDVETVSRRLTGLPTGVRERLDALAAALRTESLLDPADVDRLVARLAVGMRGVDVRTERPNAIVLLAGGQARAAAGLAETIAAALFGSPDRVVTVEAGRMTQDHDVAMLVGAPPGYIGYSDDLPIHAIARMPACVVLVLDVDLAHPRVRDLLGRAVATGVLEDGAGRPIHLSDTVVILATTEADRAPRRLGFAPLPPARPADGSTGDGAQGRGPDDAGTVPDAAAATDPIALLGPVLGDEVDLVIDRAPEAGSRETWVASTLLPEVARRLAERGVVLEWDAAAIAWLVGRGPADLRARAWERFLDGSLGPRLAAAIEAASARGGASLRLRATATPDGIVVDEIPPEPASTTPATDGGT
jgi:ATP-dependent Clp protease ATP-binding subunit ClpC